MQTKAIIFDCFGVLVTDGWLPFRDKYFGGSPELREQAAMHNTMVDKGLMSYEDFIQWLVETTGVPLPEVQRQITGNKPNEPLFTYIRDQLAPRYHIGLLSNAGDNWLHDMLEPWQVALFEEAVLSYQLGVTKPDPLMYETIAARLGVLPEECVFVDDQPRYCEGAKAIGMKAIHYQNTTQSIAEMEELFDA